MQFLFFFFSGDDLCPVKLYKIFRGHRPVAALTPSARMYLQPLRKKSTKEDDVWYSLQALGKNKLGSIIKTMYKEAGLTGRHTNHSARRTMISNSLEKGFHETRIMQVSKYIISFGI